MLWSKTLLGQSWGPLGGCWGMLLTPSGSCPLLGLYWPLSWPKPCQFGLPFWITFWVTFWILFWKCCLKVFWAQKLPRRKQGEAQRPHKVALLMLFTMVSYGFCMLTFLLLSGSWPPLGALLVPLWPLYNKPVHIHILVENLFMFTSLY